MPTISRRQQIVNFLVTKVAEIDGTGDWVSNLQDNVHGKLIFWDEVDDWPTVSISAGRETREYKSAAVNWAYLDVNIRIYVRSEDPKQELENIFGDIETVINQNTTMNLSPDTICTDIRILSISDDDGLMAPEGVGEIQLEVQYNV